MNKTPLKKRLILVIYQCILVFLLCEFALRLFRPARVVGIAHMPCIYIKDEHNGFAYIPNARGWMHRYFEMDNTVIMNTQGFHDIEHDYAAESNSLRIVAIGDSFTAALEVPVCSTWTQILQKQLNQAKRSSIQVINLGMDGTGTDVHLNVLKSYLQSHNADVVVLAFYANDLDDMRHKRFFREVYNGYIIPYQNEHQKNKIIEYIENSKPSKPTRWLYQNSYVCRAIMNRSSSSRLMRKNLVSPHRSGVEMSRYTDESWANRVEGTFLELINLSRKHGFKLFVVPLPQKDEPRASMTRLVKNLSLKVRDDLTIVDVLPTVNDLLRDQEFSYRELFWKHDNHFNVAGNRLFGDAVARIMEEHNL